jgi:hypothetical protein
MRPLLGTEVVPLMLLLCFREIRLLAPPAIEVAAPE